MDAVDALTRRTGETYSEYILRVKKNPTAVTVKLADLAHNLDESRCGGLPDSLRARYEKAVRVLEGVI